MREGYMATGDSPTVLRYVDWLITVPLQIVEFYLIVAAVSAVSIMLFWKLLLGSIVMLVGGYMGEAGLLVDPMTGFIIGMVGWVYVIYLIWVGDAAKAASNANNENLAFAFNGIKIIVTFGWIIYPIGYYMGYLSGGETTEVAGLNSLYNLADLVNKFLFGLVIWHAAMRDSGVAKS
tara:strand:- start:624 stop:1154 length:531 start_codon:yes stop_codon:yes gene_type:complete